MDAINRIISKDSLRKECILRMKLLDLDPMVIDRFERNHWITTSTDSLDDLVFMDQAQLDRIDKVETMFHGMVYYIVNDINPYNDHRVEYMFFVDSYEKEWERMRNKIEQDNPIVYECDLDMPTESTICSLGIKHVAVGDYDCSFKTIRPDTDNDILEYISEYGTVTSGPFEHKQCSKISLSMQLVNNEGISMYEVLTIGSGGGLKGYDITSEESINTNRYMACDLVSMNDSFEDIFYRDDVDTVHILFTDENAYKFSIAWIYYIYHEIVNKQNKLFKSLKFIFHMDEDYLPDFEYKLAESLSHNIQFDQQEKFALYNRSGSYTLYELDKENMVYYADDLIY